MSTTNASQITFSVPGVSCDHCRVAIRAEVEQLGGVSAVDVDLAAKTVTVSGPELDEAAIRTAIDDAGYDVA